MNWLWTSVNGIKSGITYGYNSLCEYSPMVRLVSKGASYATDTAYKYLYSPITSIITGAVSYSASTTFKLLEEAVALRDAVPALVTNPKAWEICRGMGYSMTHDVLPVVGLNFVNNNVQTFFRSRLEQDAAWYSAYSAFLAVLTLADYSVKAYTIRQGAQTFARVLVLDAEGPAAFNANKTHAPLSICVDEKCNKKRMIKGKLREPLVLMSNDVLAYGISFIPYIGQPAAKIASIFFTGRYITRLVTPEVCERHKVIAMDQQTVLALGLTNEFLAYLLDRTLEASVGSVPAMSYRALRHMMLLLIINTAAHMNLSEAKVKQSTLPFDILSFYERICRFIADVFFAGLIDRIPKDLIIKGAKPLISLSTALQTSTRLLNSNLEVEHAKEVSAFMNFASKIWQVALPPIFQNTKGLISDPVIQPHWMAIRQDAINYLNIMIKICNSSVTVPIAWADKGVATTVYLIFGIPKKLIRALLMLTQEEDFKLWLMAAKNWFERHDINKEVPLAIAHERSAGLHGDPPALVDLPEAKKTASVAIGAKDLEQKKAAVTVISSDQIVSRRTNQPLDRNRLFSKTAAAVDPEKILKKQEPSSTKSANLL